MSNYYVLYGLRRDFRCQLDEIWGNICSPGCGIVWIRDKAASTYDNVQCLLHKSRGILEPYPVELRTEGA